MADDNPRPDDQERPPSGDDGAEPSTGLPPLWQHMNQHAAPGRPFPSNVPLPIPEPPDEVPGIDADRGRFGRDVAARVASHEPAAVEASAAGDDTEPLADDHRRDLPPLPPMGGRSATGRGDHAGSGDAPGTRAQDRGRVRRPRTLRGAGAAIVALILVAGAALVITGGDGDPSAGPGDSASVSSGVAGSTSGVEVATVDLNPGDCILMPAYDIDDPFVDRVTVVACDTEHHAEVIHKVTTPMDLHADIAPRDLTSASDFLCGSSFNRYTGTDFQAGDLQLAPLVGTRRSLMVCIARDPLGDSLIGPLGSPPATTVASG